MRKALLIMFAALIVTSCGGSSTKTPDAKPSIDAAPPVPDAKPVVPNALGQICKNGTPCPAGSNCVALDLINPQPTSGYCTPPCSGENDMITCKTGYTGPATGAPVCGLSTAQGAPPNACAIGCMTDPDCPVGLKCAAVPQQTFKLCAAP
jgi:hypothetical protein